MAKKVLITGNEGFIGRNFSKYLLDRNWEVFGSDIKAGEDCRDRFKVDDTQYDLVIHCAAIVGGRLKIDNEPLSVATDLSIDSEMFNWALKTKQKRIVYFSSSAAYPTGYQVRGSHLNLKEDHINLSLIKEPDMTYGWSKLTGEYLSKYMNEQGIPVHVFRPFSGYGPDQDLDYPFPSFIQRAKERPDKFEIWGGEQIRDFIHVDDIVHLVMQSVKYKEIGPFNLCTGVATSFLNLAQTIFKVSGWEPEHGLYLRDDMPIGVFRRVGNPKLMKENLGIPKISLREGIERSLEWQG